MANGSSENGYGPPADALDIGFNHLIKLTNFEGEPAGISYWHQTKHGRWCKGWVDFKGKPWAASFGPDVGWDLLQLEPLTLSPSLLCRVCGDH